MCQTCNNVSMISVGVIGNEFRLPQHILIYSTVIFIFIHKINKIVSFIFMVYIPLTTSEIHDSCREFLLSHVKPYYPTIYVCILVYIVPHTVNNMCERITKVYIHVLGYITDQNIIIFKIFLNYIKRHVCMLCTMLIIRKNDIKTWLYVLRVWWCWCLPAISLWVHRPSNGALC